MSVKSVRALGLVLLVFLVAASGVYSQPPNLKPVDPKRESPRATLKTFLEAFQQPRLDVTPDPLDEAVKCLDLEGIPVDYRSMKGLEIAAQLHQVIAAIENFHIEDVPAEKSGDPYHVYRSPVGEVVIAKQANGEWLFTRETDRIVPLLVTEIEDQQRLHGAATLTQSDTIGSKIREQMPNSLKQRTLMLERWQWIGLALLFLLGIAMWQLVRLTGSFIIGRLLKRWHGGLTEDQLKSLYSPLGLMAFVIVVRIGLRMLALTQGSLAMLRTGMFILTAAAIMWLAYRVIDIVIFRLRQRSLGTESQTDDLLIPFVGAIIRFAIVVIGVIVVAENLNFNVTGLIAGLGIGGIAIALASQETLSNFFGSLVLLIEAPFKSDDRVDVDGVKGTVKEVGFRSTRILTFDNALITVPNATIAKANIINRGVRRRRTWLIDLAVPHSNGPEKIEKLCERLADVIGENESLDSNEFKVRLFEIKGASLTLRIVVAFNVDTFAYETDARHRFILDILKLADELEMTLEVPN